MRCLLCTLERRRGRNKEWLSDQVRLTLTRPMPGQCQYEYQSWYHSSASQSPSVTDSSNTDCSAPSSDLLQASLLQYAVAPDENLVPKVLNLKVKSVNFSLNIWMWRLPVRPCVVIAEGRTALVRATAEGDVIRMYQSNRLSLPPCVSYHL